MLEAFSQPLGKESEMFTNTPTAPGQQALSSLSQIGSLQPSATMVACADSGLTATDDTFIIKNPPTTPAQLVLASASRLFMASGTAATSSPAAGGGGISGVGNGGSDGGRGGKKSGRTLLLEILQSAGHLSPKQQSTHLSFALAQGMVTREELKAFFTEHLMEEHLAPLRHRFVPELLTNNEVIDRALKEAEAGKVSNQTLARLRRRNGDGSTQVMKENEPFLFAIPYEDAGPIMQALMLRFARATEPKSSAPNFGLYPTHDHRPDAIMHNNEQEYARRLATRQAIVSAMMALDTDRSTAFFEAMLAARLSPDAHYPESSQVAREAEAHIAARAALVQIGGRQLLERLESLVESAYDTNENARLLPEFGEKPPFQEMGTSLLNMLRSGEASKQEIKETVMRIMEGALTLYDKRITREEHDPVIFSMDSSFSAIGEIGIWSSIPLSEKIKRMLDANDSWNLQKRKTLASLMKGLKSSAKRLPDAKNADIALEPHIRRILMTVFSVFGKFEEISTSPEGAHHIESFRYHLREILDNIILTMMDQVPSELVAHIENDPASRGAFSVWREVNLTDQGE
jgi:hypothetical protein